MKRLILLPLAWACLVSSLAQAAPTACPSAKFPVFFAKYADSVALQKAFTVDPLEHVMLDHAAVPEPRQVKSTLAKAALSYPLVPAKAVRKQQGLALRINEVSGTHASATLFKADTGYLVTYFFRNDGCWQLERREDLSM
jgi:hypothetical protein